MRVGEGKKKYWNERIEFLESALIILWKFWKCRKINWKCHRCHCNARDSFGTIYHMHTSITLSHPHSLSILFFQQTFSHLSLVHSLTRLQSKYTFCITSNKVPTQKVVYPKPDECGKVSSNYRKIISNGVCFFPPSFFSCFYSLSWTIHRNAFFSFFLFFFFYCLDSIVPFAIATYKTSESEREWEIRA